MAKTKHKCFACGTPTEAVVWKVQGKAYRRRICSAFRCWQKWWRLADEAA